MRTISKKLTSLTAHDLMTEAVVAIPRAMSLRGAAHLLAQSAISGAPVVDSDGHCVGVLSTTDFVSWADNGASGKRHRTDYPCAHSAWQVMDPEEISEEEVSRFMTPQVITVAAETTIVQMARMMTNAHIHRLIVVDQDNRPIGIVSSTDIVAAVAYAEEGKKEACTVPSSYR